MPANRFAPQLVLILLLLASRLLLHALGFAPDPATIVGHWQHIDLRFLWADPWGSLWDLHSQPPLWNAILALAVRLAGPDPASVTGVMYCFNLALTACGGFLMISVLRRIGFATRASTVLAALWMLSPNTLYFETYVFYPHFTAFLVTLLVWLLARVKRGGPLLPAVAALGVLTCLAWTWAIFHPAFIALAAGMLVIWHGGWTFKPAARPLIALAVLATGVSTLPTLKNALVHGVPSASTWIGMNLAQTVPGGQSGELADCDFEIAYHKAFAAGSPPIPGHPLLTETWKQAGVPNMNNIGLIEPSKRCARMMMARILEDPLAWLGARLTAMVESFQLPPSNYNADPLGWDAIFGGLERATENLGPLGRSILTFWYLLLIFTGLRAIGGNRPFYLALAGTVLYFTLASHLLNGGEQARMRYTIEPIYFLWSALLLKRLIAWFSSPGDGAGWRQRGLSRAS